MTTEPRTVSREDLMAIYLLDALRELCARDRLSPEEASAIAEQAMTPHPIAPGDCPPGSRSKLGQYALKP